MTTRLILLHAALLSALLAGLGACGGGPAEVGELPRPEHPRPDFERSAWLNLNGAWDFQFDPRDQGLDDQWFSPGAAFDRSIRVPFCWESELSGVRDRTLQQIGWYRRQVAAPAAWSGQRVWLRFEAVDWEARVWLDGEEIGRNEGGYTPFAFDVTDRLPPGKTAMLTVRAFDPTSRELPSGKQVARWYTPVSGIWQTVWLEARPAGRLDGFKLVSRPTQEGWDLTAELTTAGAVSGVELAAEGVGTATALARADGVYFARLAVPGGEAWTPETPKLYPLEIRVAGADGAVDTVKSYFALRTIERGSTARRARIDPAQWPAGLPARGARPVPQPGRPLHRAERRVSAPRPGVGRRLGFNFLRIHIKAEEPRRLYWADRLGVLLMEDVPNCWQLSERCRQAWEATAQAMIERDRNHPSIIAWTLFNETWGLGAHPERYGDEYRNDPATQQWVLDQWLAAKALDPSRLIEDNSPNKFDHVRTDLNSWHFYTEDWEAARAGIERMAAGAQVGSQLNYLDGYRQDGAPLINSEYGAVPANGGDRDISFGFKHLTNLLRRHAVIQGYIYTELTDIEHEHNGLLNYDRSPKQTGYEAFVPGLRPADLQGEDFVGYLGPPVIEARPGERLQLQTFVSHYSEREQPPTLQATLIGMNDLGGEIELLGNPRKVRWERHSVIDQAPLPITVPEIRNYVGAIRLELLDDSGDRVAANYVTIVVRGSEQSPRRARITPRLLALRADPAYFDAIQ